ncbi:MAG: hypothetical protein QNJ36_03185 [Calothrix sp. MO_167.B42]|nr:hypothetical protein [Calothrix sp. MO_167.B42]
MSICSPGERARVTLPDGSEKSFTDTPVSIEVTPNPVGEKGQIGKMFYRRSGRSSYTYYNGRLYGQVYSVSVVNHVPFWSVVSSSNTNSRGGFSETPGQRIHGTTTFPVSLDDWYFLEDGSNDELRPTYTITVTGSSGILLFEKQYNNENYSVECVQGCPPGTLDCGDCCLDCNDIYTEIVSLRLLTNSIN